MRMRQRLWVLIGAVSAFASVATFSGGTWLTAALLAVAAAFAFHRSTRSIHSPVLDDWLLALAGKDPFDPDARPKYLWQGAVSTFCIALRVKAHPLLGSQVLLLFRDEVADDVWRKLQTLARHGPHANQEQRRGTFEIAFE